MLTIYMYCSEIKNILAISHREGKYTKTHQQRPSRLPPLASQVLKKHPILSFNWTTPAELLSDSLLCFCLTFTQKFTISVFLFFALKYIFC